MKLIGRTIIILIAALVVVGATFAYGRSGYAGGGRERFPTQGDAAAQDSSAGQPGFDPAAPGAGSGEFRRGEGPGGRDHNRGPSLFGVGEIVKDLLIIGIIVAAVSLVMHRWNGGRDQAPAAQE